MTKAAVVFSGRNGLDFSELRSGVLRIPDVTLRIREAQRIIDMALGAANDSRGESESITGSLRVDLMALLASEDEYFFRNIKLKGLLAAIVQIGLYDRYLRTQKRPDFLIGNSNGDSAMLVCSGQMTFEEMVKTSQALDTLKPADKVIPIHAGLPTQQQPQAGVVVPLAVGAMPLLSGLSLTEYTALQMKAKNEGGTEYEQTSIAGMDLRKIITTLHEDFEVGRFINVGPASALASSDYRSISTGEIEALDSIDLDPMLSWFWRNMRSASLAAAQ